MDGERLCRGSCVVGSISDFAQEPVGVASSLHVAPGCGDHALPSIRNVERMIPSYSFP